MSKGSELKSSSSSPLGVVLRLYMMTMVPDSSFMESNCFSSDCSVLNGEYLVMRLTSVECYK